MVDLYIRISDFSDAGDLASERLPVYLGIFCFAQSVLIVFLGNIRLSHVKASVFQLVMAIDAVHARNTLQFTFLTFVSPCFVDFFC